MGCDDEDCSLVLCNGDTREDEGGERGEERVAFLCGDMEGERGAAWETLDAETGCVMFTRDSSRLLLV